MFAPMFDGQFRSKPPVSLRGASKQGVLSNSLLSKARHLREERERERRRNASTITIQAWYRGHVIRKKVYSEVRRRFDSGCVHCSDPSHLFTLSSQLLLFYQETRDQERLVLLCQKWIQFQVLVLKELGKPKSPSHFLLQRMLVLCLHSLYTNPTQPLASPLRMIDVYANGREAQSSSKIFDFLLTKGYYATLRKLIETRLPSPDEDTPLTPLGASLMEYLLQPIKLKITDLYSFIVTELLAPPLSPHLCYMILSALENSNLLLSSLLEVTANKLNNHTLKPSATLCYCVLRLLQAQMDSLLETDVGHLLLLISTMMESWTSDKMTLEDQEEEEELEDNRDLDDMELDPTSGTFALTSCILEKVTNGPVVDVIMKFQNPSDTFLCSLCSTCYHLLANASFSPVRHRLVRSLALSSLILKRIWLSLSTMTLKRAFGPSVNAFDHFRRGSSVPSREGHALLHQLSSFSVLLSISLSSLHDVELSSMGPFSLQELGKMALKLRDVYVSLNMTILHPQTPFFVPVSSSQIDTSQGPKICEWQLLSNVLYRLLKSLYDRNSRLEFCPISSWASLSLDNVPPDLFLESEEDEDLARPPHPAVVFKQANLLKKVPFVFSFKDRVTFFHKLVKYTRNERQGRFQDFLIGPSISITARRSHLYEDAFSKLSTQDLRQRLRVLLINEQGLEEAGIDGGGLFREFLSETLKTGFDPNRGFFTTTKEGLLFPNPTVYLVNESCSLHYKFLGALLGKVLLEQMMVELPFAPFFLCKLTSSGRGWIDTHHLGSLDPELYHHLMWLKNYQGDFEELGLDFTTLSNEFGQSRVVELKPGGGSVQVTWDNRIEYIHLLANYHLNCRIDTQFQSFREGLSTVIPIQWLTLFNQSELQTLISGAEEPINMADLKEHTSYSGSYKEDHYCIDMFWSIVSEFSELEKRQLLKFVTSCSRPPLLGFKELHPSFTISSAKETDHLPSASTCMHLLKLPMFETKQEMKEKLVYAISSGAGFELS